jgi:hypothetical protein
VTNLRGACGAAEPGVQLGPRVRTAAIDARRHAAPGPCRIRCVAADLPGGRAGHALTRLGRRAVAGRPGIAARRAARAPARRAARAHARRAARAAARRAARAPARGAARAPARRAARAAARRAARAPARRAARASADCSASTAGRGVGSADRVEVFGAAASLDDEPDQPQARKHHRRASHRGQHTGTCSR